LNEKYGTLEDFVKNETPCNSVDEYLIKFRLVNSKEYDQLMEREPVTGTITCPDGSKVELEDYWSSVQYPISQLGTYTFTAVTSEGKSSKIDVKVEEEYMFDGRCLSYGFKRIDITNENNPKVKYIKHSVEQEGDLTDCIDNGEIDLYDVHSKFGLLNRTNIEITVEVEGKELKWSGLLFWVE